LFPFVISDTFKLAAKESLTVQPINNYIRVTYTLQIQIHIYSNLT